MSCAALLVQVLGKPLTLRSQTSGPCDPAAYTNAKVFTALGSRSRLTNHFSGHNQGDDTMTDRTIRLGLSAETMTDIANITGNDALFGAIGYLSTWGMGHAFCEIIGGVYDGVPEIIATYRGEELGKITYQIGAVWHTDHFGFHS
jgi:hypothetical protein